MGGQGVMEPSVGADPASGQSVNRGSSVVANPLEDPGKGSAFGGVSLEEQRAGRSNIGPNEGAKERYYDTRNNDQGDMNYGKYTPGGNQQPSGKGATTEREENAASALRPPSGNNTNTMPVGQKLPE